MKKQQGIEIVKRMRAQGFTLTGWSRANGFSIRTVNEVLYAEHGCKRGGKMTKKIIEALTVYGFTEEQSHEQIPLNR